MDALADLDGMPTELPPTEPAIVAVARIEAETAQAAGSLTKRAEAMTVTTSAEAQRANDFLGEIIAHRKRIEDWFAEPVNLAHRAWKALTQRRASVLEHFTAPERIVKVRLANFRAAEERTRREAEKVVVAEARRIAEERQLAAALAAEQRGETERAAKILEAPPPPVAVPPVAVPEPTKLDGTAFVEVWKAEVTDFAALVRAVANDIAPIALLQPNMTAINQMARALKGAMNVPGIAVRSETMVRRTGRG